MYRFIPTPSTSEISAGPFVIHFYALCIILGVAVAIYVGDRRFRRFGGSENVIADVAIVAIPAGIIGGRLYHVATSPDAYFGDGGKPLDVLKIWQGGLGIWGAIALGSAAAYWQYQRLGRRNREGLLSFAIFADALAPGILLAQAIGRFGNWFNAELFGRPTTLPWGLEIPIQKRPIGYQSFETFHPTFLYEAIWCVIIAILIVAFERRFRNGQIFLFYVMGYSVGRFFIENLRIDEAHLFLGIRINVFMSLFVAVVAGFFYRKISISTQSKKSEL